MVTYFMLVVPFPLRSAMLRWDDRDEEGQRDYKYD